jgi:hypothetical protein
MSFIEEYIKENADEEYCPYCYQERGAKWVCCGEIHFIPFKDLDPEQQRYIAMSEYEANLK